MANFGLRLATQKRKKWRENHVKILEKSLYNVENEQS